MPASGKRVWTEKCEPQDAASTRECEPQDAASGARPPDKDELWVSSIRGDRFLGLVLTVGRLVCVLSASRSRESVPSCLHDP